MSSSLEENFVQKFSQLWSSYTSRALETDEFMKEFVKMSSQINSQRLSHKVVAQTAFKNHVDDHITNTIGVLRAISENIRSPAADSVIRCLAMALRKAEDNVSLPLLTFEKKVLKTFRAEHK